MALQVPTSAVLVTNEDEWGFVAEKHGISKTERDRMAKAFRNI
jgi:hypothetical protein